MRAEVRAGARQRWRAVRGWTRSGRAAPSCPSTARRRRTARASSSRRRGGSRLARGCYACWRRRGSTFSSFGRSSPSRPRPQTTSPRTRWGRSARSTAARCSRRGCSARPPSPSPSGRSRRTSGRATPAGRQPTRGTTSRCCRTSRRTRSPSSPAGACLRSEGEGEGAPPKRPELGACVWIRTHHSTQGQRPAESPRPDR
mmetsp:Transcript_47905/g.150492  ORF Transcript_47905/g.150492 Transcript_47905/m.150492 type:complete len:200 (+) Transcript_47905:271-870(+)